MLPQALTDFVFDLYDSVTLSQLPEEQGRLYNSVLKDLSSKVRQSGAEEIQNVPVPLDHR